MKNRILSLLLCLCLVSSVNAFATVEPMHNSGGWNETLWFEAPDILAADVTEVRYCGPVSGSLTGQDFAYLVRDTEDGLRIDIPGLPGGEYTLTVTTKWWTFSEAVAVQAQDRSGYAHFGYTDGVGAYNDDGTLKENAIVLYVTEENKDTVTITSKDGTTVSGIGNILNSRGRNANAGSKVNTNQDILHKLAGDGTPLVVRIIGRVTLPEGLTAYNSRDYGGSVGDNGAMARMQGGKDITIEGIGVGATIDGWGLHFICGGGDYARGWGKSFEVRNLTFRNVPEDCVGMEGEQDGSTLNAPVERCWIHHCAFYGPKIANPAESDKDGGDGACDFKRGQYFTNAYCYYEGYHKTNLVGGSDSNLQYHMTYHHNYWKNCESRGPLARQANIHMYNNIFEGQTSYCMNPRANAYIFSEYNLFLNCKNPVRVKLGAVKSYQDSFENCRGDNHATIVTDKTQQVDTDCKYANFDTNPAISYIPQGGYLLHDTIEVMQATVMAQAGPQQRHTEATHTHGYGSAVTTQATCETEGVMTYTCACGDSYTEPIPAEGHKLTEWIIAPGGGQQWRHCENCDYEEYEDLPPCSHEDIQWDEGVAPNCTEDGRQPSGLCLDCGSYAVLGEVIPATGHELVATDNAPTCTENAVVVISCVKCGMTDQEIHPATGHSYGENGVCASCGQIDPDAATQTQPAPTTQPEETIPLATEPQPVENNDVGKTILTVILAVAAAGFIVATILELKRKS